MIKGKKINLRLVDTKDAEFILALRLNEKLSKFISKVENDLQSQINWIQAYKERERVKQEFYFIIEDKKSIPYGTVRIYDFIGDSFCWGSWLISEYAPVYASIESALLVYEFAFYNLGSKRSHFDVKKENQRVVAFHKRFGAKIVKEDEINFYFTFSREDYEKTRIKYGKYLPAET